jgi:hypothetical protein
MSRIPTHQCLPSGRGGFIVGGVAEALKLSSLAIKKENGYGYQQ